MRRYSATLLITALVSSLLLAACGGGDATVGGTVSGLPASASVVLQNNGADNLTVSTNGNFTFSKSVESDKTYSVTVLTQPTGANCAVASGSGSGTIDANGTNVSGVAVTCTVSLTGTLFGLAPGASVTLSNAGVTLPLAVNGAFAFPGGMAAGTAYRVTVSTQPLGGQTCTVTSGGSGTIVSGTPTAVVVTCTP